MIDNQRILLENGIKKFGSQSELAKALKYPRQQINMYLRGDNEMRYSTYLYFKDKIEL